MTRQHLVPWKRDALHKSRAGHPGSPRCSSLTYAQYARSSRLAIRAPRSGTYATHHASRGLVPNDTGSALLIALLATFLLGAIAAALILVTSTETLIAGAQRHAEETACAADAAFELAVHDLTLLATWGPPLAEPPANATSSVIDGRQVVRVPDGRTLDLSVLMADRQRESDAVYGPGVFGADSPRWRLFLHAALQDVLPPGTPSSPAYLVAWVADDGADGDGDPTIDSNGRILVHAEAFGAGSARRAVEGAIGRTPDGVVQVLAWREVRQRMNGL